MKTIKRGLGLLTAVLCLHTAIHAQNSYQFQSTTAGYTELVNAKRVPWPAFDPNTDMYPITEVVGETFYFYKLPFPFGGVKTFMLESNGTVRIDNDSALVIIDGAFSYLDSIDATSSVSYTVDGTAGNMVFKGQWKNVKLRVGPAVNFINFQIWIYQSTGIVEIHYGPRSANNASGYNTTNGPQVGMFFSKDDFTKCYEKLWVNGSPTAPTLDSFTNYTFRAMQGVPDIGTVYRFLPRFNTTGINSISRLIVKVAVYPNPASDRIYFNFQSQPLRGTAGLYDVQGKLVCEKEFNLNSSCNEGYIDIGLLCPGLHTLVLRTPDQTFVEKVHVMN